MRNLKQKVDMYFELDGNPSGQLLYYGMIGSMSLIMIAGTISNIFSN